LKDIYDKLIQMAISRGAASAKVIPIEDISVNDWVRQKCEFGCTQYGKKYTCPPYVQPPKETRKRLKEYDKALILKFGEIKDRMEWRGIQKLMAELEREAFLNGLYKAFAYGAGTCKLCDECTADQIQTPTLFDKRKCVYRRIARPSMEGVGIDVFQTAKNAGYELKVVPNEDMCFTSFCLLLLE
jgi:predicted metal-binding protein